MSVSDEIIKVLDALAEKFGVAIDWTAENIIPYFEKLCGKYVNFEIATSIIWLVFGAIMIALGFVFLKYCKSSYVKSKDDEKYDYSQREDYEYMTIFFGLLTIIGLVAGTVIILRESLDIITCYTFPEKIILEEVKYLYDSMK